MTIAWWGKWGLRVAVAAVLVHVVTILIWPDGHFTLIDLRIYRESGQWLLDGTPLYAHGYHGTVDSLLYNYPPFAAVLFLPLSLLPVQVMPVVGLVGNLALLYAVVHRCCRSLGWTGVQLRGVALLAAGALLWLEPVRTVLNLGQINLLLLAMVVFDLTRPAERRWRGLWVGVAAGIKLTPLLFVPYLLITRQFRAAAVATGTFGAMFLAGFLIRPSDATTYWFGGTLTDGDRLGGGLLTGNQSFNGMLGRLGITAQPLWLAGAVVITAATLWVARLAHRRGETVLAIGIVGLCSAAVAPFAWGYHWVWFVPVAVHLLRQAVTRHDRVAAGLLGALWLTTTAWFVEFPAPSSGKMPPVGMISLRPGGWVEHLTSNIYLLAFVVILPVAWRSFVAARSVPAGMLPRPRGLVRQRIETE